MSHPNQQPLQPPSQNGPEYQSTQYPPNTYPDQQTRNDRNPQGPSPTTNYPDPRILGYPQPQPVQPTMMHHIQQPEQPPAEGYNPPPDQVKYICTPPPVTPGVFPNPNSSPFTTTPRMAGQNTSPPPPIRFQCDKCGTTFSRQHDRNRHYESTHAKNPPVHRCERCKKHFSRADAKKRHQDDGKCSNSS